MRCWEMRWRARLGLPIGGDCHRERDRGCLIERTEDLVVQLGSGRYPCTPGLCFGSRYASERGRRAPPPELGV